jgi:hypothetical protein
MLPDQNSVPIPMGQGRPVTAEGGENCKSAGFLPLTDAFGSNCCESTGIFNHFCHTCRLEVKNPALSQKFECSGYQ